MRRFRKLATSILLTLLSTQVAAGEYCWNEKVRLVILNSEGRVYFTTDKSCPHWCLINPNWSQDQIDRVYSMLLTAKTADKPIAFYWPSHSTTCEGTVAVYSQPSTLIY